MDYFSWFINIKTRRGELEDQEEDKNIKNKFGKKIIYFDKEDIIIYWNTKIYLIH